MRIEPGVVVADRYRVERLLGQGGMGAVYEATDLKFGARVALKIAGATGAGYEEFKARFAREARLGNRLGRRPGFVRALDWGELPDGVRLYLALDLVEGARPLPLTAGPRAERLGRLLRAAELVAVAHAQGIVHRDLKPANVLQDAAGALFLADFGLAKATTDEPDPEGAVVTGGFTRTGVGMGTAPFMAPEQFDDAKRVDARADVYALGVMLHLALVEEYPYPGADPVSVLVKQQRVRDGAAPAPSPRARDATVPEALDRLCLDATALRVEARLPTAEGFVARLRAALDPAAAPTVLDPTPTPPAPTPPAPAPPAPTPPGPTSPRAPARRRWARRALVLGAAVGAWLAVVGVVQAGGPPAALVGRVLPDAAAWLVDFTPPEVDLDPPFTDMAFGVQGTPWMTSGRLVVTGRVRDAFPCRAPATPDGPAVPLAAGDGRDQTLSTEVLLSPGDPAAFLVVVQDAAGNQRTVYRTVAQVPLEVALEAAPEGAAARVRGSLFPSPPGPYRVRPAGALEAVPCEGPSFEVSVPLAPGQEHVTVEVLPPAGDPVRATAPLRRNEGKGDGGKGGKG